MSDNGPSPWSDPWLQVFGLTALLCAAMSAHHLLGRKAAPAPPGAAEPQPKQVAAPAPTPSSAPTRHAQKADEWMVDGAMASGADKATIGEAVALAKSGDTIFVRPGVYAEALLVDKSVTITGLGDRRSQVRIESGGAATVSVSAGQTMLQNVFVSNTGNRDASAVLVESGGSVDLLDASVGGAGRGVRTRGGVVSAMRSDVAARIGLLAESGAQVTWEKGSVSGSDIGAMIKGDDARGFFRSVRFSDSVRGLDVEGASRATLTGCSFELSAADGGAVYSFSGSEVHLSSTSIALSGAAQVGLFLEGARAEAAWLSIRGGKGAGIALRKSASLRLAYADVMDNGGAGISARDGASVDVARSRIAGNKRCGVELDDAAVLLDRVTVEKNRCGAAFLGKGRLTSYNGVYRDNELGAVGAREGLSDAAVAVGSGNTGWAPGGRMIALKIGASMGQ